MEKSASKAPESEDDGPKERSELDKAKDDRYVTDAVAEFATFVSLSNNRQRRITERKCKV